MVQVFFTDEGGCLRVDANGHANLKNTEGVDVYCAAVTTLTNTLAVNAIRAFEAGELEEEPTVYTGSEGEGRARVVIKPRAEYYSTLSLMFRAVLMGYQMLAAFHGDAVEYVEG